MRVSASPERSRSPRVCVPGPHPTVNATAKSNGRDENFETLQSDASTYGPRPEHAPNFAEHVCHSVPLGEEFMWSRGHSPKARTTPSRAQTAVASHSNSWGGRPSITTTSRGPVATKAAPRTSMAAG